MILLSRSIAWFLMCALLSSSSIVAQCRTTAPDAVRSCVLKLGVGRWVRVYEGRAQFSGQITSIGPRVFELEQRDHAGRATVDYGCVTRIKRTHGPRQGFDAPPGAWVGLAVAAGVLALYLTGGDSGCNNSPSRQTAR